MQRNNIAAVVLTTAMAAGVGLALTSEVSAGIASTVHNFSARAWNPAGHLCEVCHTPHHAMDVTDAPLWNHDITATDPFTLYASGSLDSVPGQPTGASRLCLSCHDGTVSVDAYGGSAGGTEFVTGSALLGTDLSTTHPISITYDAALLALDSELFDPAADPSGLGGTIAGDLLFGALNDQLECASCHDPHTDAQPNFLVKSNSGSALCLTCHDK